MYTHIMVATDGSEHGNIAVRTACDLASRFDAELTVVHVMGEGDVPDTVKRLIDAEHLADPPRIEFPDASDLGSGIALIRGVGETSIRRYQMWAALARLVVADAEREAKQRGVKRVSTRIEEGDAVEKILETLRVCGADLVVLGRRGVSDFKGLVLGSVTHKVSQLADCAVLTVK